MSVFEPSTSSKPQSNMIITSRVDMQYNRVLSFGGILTNLRMET
jgi:hypothetical protein